MTDLANYKKQTDSGSQKPICSVSVKPSDEQSLSLGFFSIKNLPKGFSLEIAPDPKPLDSVVTSIIRKDMIGRCEFILRVVNAGRDAVSAKVWQV